MNYENLSNFLTNDELAQIDSHIYEINTFIQDNAPKEKIISINLNDFDAILNHKFTGILFFEYDGTLPSNNFKVYFQFTNSKKISKTLLDMNYLEKLFIIKNWDRIKYFLTQYIKNDNKVKEKLSKILEDFTL